VSVTGEPAYKASFKALSFDGKKMNAKYVGVQYTAADMIEFTVREDGTDLYLLACNRSRETFHITFENLPQTEPTAEVMFEAPRTVEAKWISRDVEKPKKTTVQLGTLTDWFAPFEVHVYKLKRK